MRRVVVTGMGIACPLGHRRRACLEAADQRRIRHQRDPVLRHQGPAVPRSRARCRAGTKADGRLDIAEWIPVKDQKKMDRFIHLGLVAATEAVEDSGWVPETEEDRCATGVMIGSGIGGLQTIYEASILVHAGQGAAAVAVLHPVRADQPGLRPRLDQIRLQGPEPLGGDRLRHRRACDRRRGAADHAGRCRRDGGRRRRGGGLRARHRRVLRLARAVHRVQRHARARPRAPGTRTATASSWARAPAWWCWRNTSTPRRAAPRSTPRSAATACRATRITSPPRPRAMTARSAR